MNIVTQLEQFIGSSAWTLISTEATGRQLSVRCRAAEHEVTFWVQPVCDEQSCYSRGVSFMVGYPGSEMAPAGLSLLDALTDALRRAEAAGESLEFPEVPGATEGAEPVLIYGTDQVELRVTKRCMETCVFCNSWNLVDNLADTREKAMDVLVSAARLGAGKLVISGGEPLLVPWVADLVARARELGYRHVTLQTNGVLLSRPAGQKTLSLAPPDDILVSMHGASREVVGSITGRPDLFDDKRAGLQGALGSGIPTAINFVVCRQNLGEILPFVQWAAGLTPAPYLISFSFVAPSGLAWDNRETTIPRVSKAAPALLAGLELALDMGLAVVHSEYCGIPTCVLPELRRFSEPFTPERPIHVPPSKTKLPVCEGCSWNDRCSGIFKRYIDLYSGAEFGDDGGSQ